MNLHTPERGEAETFADYKSRRKQSHIANGLPGKNLFVATRKKPQHANQARALHRDLVARAGGIRQFKRDRSLSTRAF